MTNQLTINNNDKGYEHIFVHGGKGWWVNAGKSGLMVKPMRAMLGQIEAMLSNHSRVMLIRFDLRMESYTPDNKIITVFNRRLFKWVKAQYGVSRIGFVWCRELERAKRQHYHYALMLDGSKVNYPNSITKKVIQIWSELSGSAYVPKNCYYIMKRDCLESQQDAVYRISYLAKARGKGYKATQAKNYGASRIKPRANEF